MGARAVCILGLLLNAGPGLAATPEAAELAPAPRAPDPAHPFLPLAAVLHSPRCQNCHPVGDRPKVGDRGAVHAMNISRHSPRAGLPCAACHREHNAPLPGSPPGAPHWGLPPAQTAMGFEGLSAAALCAQLKDPARNGGRSVSAIVQHLTHDALVLWAWSPGPGRSPPPLALDAWQRAVSAWDTAGAPCPASAAEPATP